MKWATIFDGGPSDREKDEKKKIKTKGDAKDIQKKRGREERLI